MFFHVLGGSPWNILSHYSVQPWADRYNLKPDFLRNRQTDIDDMETTVTTFSMLVLANRGSVGVVMHPHANPNTYLCGLLFVNRCKSQTFQSSDMVLENTTQTCSSEITVSFQKIYFIKVQLFYNVLIFAVQQSDSVTYIFFFIFFSIMVYYRTLTVVPCSIQQNHVAPSFHTQQFPSANSKLPIHSFPTALRLGNHKSVLCLETCSQFFKEAKIHSFKCIQNNI